MTIGEWTPELTAAWIAFADLAATELGNTEYEYYAIPIRWNPPRKRGRSGEHTRPITGLDQYKTTREEWEKNAVESREKRVDAFLGKLKSSYIDYVRLVKTPGWREKVIDAIKAEA